MPHVSKRLLEKTKFSDIHYDFFKTIAELSRSGDAKAILEELLTKTEKLMLAKRLAIIAMLSKGESIYSIEQVLKVSPSTVARMSVLYENDAYKTLLRGIKAKDNFWVQLEKIIPPRVGRNRFKSFLKF